MTHKRQRMAAAVALSTSMSLFGFAATATAATNEESLPPTDVVATETSEPVVVNEPTVVVEEPTVVVEKPRVGNPLLPPLARQRPRIPRKPRPWDTHR